MKKIILRNVTIASSLFIILVFFQNCGQVQNSVKFGSITPPDPTAVVCGGFDSDDSEDPNYGIVGNIFVSNQTSNPGLAVKYATDANPLKNQAGDLINIYLNNLDVPTRSFTDGFVNQSGGSLTDNNGNVLIEYFGLKLRFSLKLPDDFTAGYYQVGIESDDGSVINTLDSDNQMKTLINNDGTHATAAKCASKALYLDHTTVIPSELYYFQGPRQHIALRLVWKKVANQNPSATCGTIGNADGSAASNYWKVIPSTAFELPISEQINPCVND